jgi:hypothetical protein
MYLSDILKSLVDQKLQEICVGKRVLFYPEENNGNKTIITCKSVEFGDDDGDCWLEFTDSEDKKYTVIGQGIDIYFKIIE